MTVEGGKKLDHTIWRNRLNNRNDMAARITHLTRGNDAEDAFKNLWKILVDKKYILSAMGLLSKLYPEIAIRIMKKELKYDRN